MSAIGTLKAKDKSSYSFSIKTLTQKITGDLVPVKEKKGNGPERSNRSRRSSRAKALRVAPWRTAAASNSSRSLGVS